MVSSMRENLNLFSALSMNSGDVPRMRHCWRCRAMAMLLGSWPPMERMIPSGFSLS